MKIGILTGGGDCQGLNAAIRAVVRKALDFNFDVEGIQRGWLGLIENIIEPMSLRSVSGILPLGGTILGTSRTNPAKIENGYEKIKEVVKKRKLDAVVAIGGDDTLSVCLELCRMGIPAVGIPKTMDNDVGETDFCIGFDSSVSVVAEALDRLHTTAHAHHRVIVVEVMGRDTGWVAMYGGLAGGADLVMIPEFPTTIEETCEHLKKRRSIGKDFSIIVVAEGVTMGGLDLSDDESKIDSFGHVRLDKRNIGNQVANAIEHRTGFETRTTVLGYLQRGGTPSVFDRVLATRLGVKAIEEVKAGNFGKMIAYKNNQMVPVELETAIKHSPKKVPKDLFKLVELFY